MTALRCTFACGSIEGGGQGQGTEGIQATQQPCQVEGGSRLSSSADGAPAVHHACSSPCWLAESGLSGRTLDGLDTAAWASSPRQRICEAPGRT